MNARDKAMREYLGGEVHRAYRCIDTCIELLKTYDEELKNGTLNPHFENYCGRNQFTKVLTVSPKVTYLGCEGCMNDWTEDNKLSQYHPELVDTAKAELGLNELPPKEFNGLRSEYARTMNPNNHLIRDFLIPRISAPWAPSPKPLGFS